MTSILLYLLIPSILFSSVSHSANPPPKELPPKSPHTTQEVLNSSLQPPLTLKTNQKIDLIVVNKTRQVMTLWAGKEAVKTYLVSLGNPKGRKEMEGDLKTPEGEYKISSKNSNSQFFLSLEVSYPNSEDRKRAAKKGVSPGGGIMIHGISDEYAWAGAYHALFNWTRGCIAVSNSEVDEIFKHVKVGTRIQIQP